MNKNAIFRVIIWSMAIVVLLGIMLGTMVLHKKPAAQTTAPSEWAPQSGGKVSATTEKVSGVMSTRLVSASEVTELEITWASGSITLLPGQGSDLQINESGDTAKYPIEIKQSGSKLIINFTEGNLAFRNNVGKKDLIVTVPEGWNCRALSVTTASSDLIIDGLTIQSAEIQSASADCKFTDCAMGSLTVNTASGNIHFSGSLEQLDCNAASADLDISVSNIPSSIFMKGMSGDLLLTLPKDAGFTASIRTVSGSFYSEFSTEKDGSTYTHGDGQCSIEMQGVSSDISICSAAE